LVSSTPRFDLKLQVSVKYRILKDLPIRQEIQQFWEEGEQLRPAYNSNDRLMPLPK
jgi:hypothetical protein